MKLECKATVLSESGCLIAVFKPYGPAAEENDVLEIIQTEDDGINQKSSIKILDEYEMSQLRDFLNKCLEDIQKRDSALESMPLPTTIMKNLLSNGRGD
jgi:hypothetical protein